MASSSRRFSHAYWIEVGRLREQQRIIDLFESRLCPTSGEHDWIENEQCLCQTYIVEDIVGLIRDGTTPLFDPQQEKNFDV